MISRISAIYQEAYCKSSMADIKDSKLSDDIQKELDRITDYGPRDSGKGSAMQWLYSLKAL